VASDEAGGADDNRCAKVRYRIGLYLPQSEVMFTLLNPHAVLIEESDCRSTPLSTLRYTDPLNIQIRG